MDWFDLLAVQGILKSLLQHRSSKASILQLSASFMVQLSHPYMTVGKTIALTRWTFVSKVMSLLCNMLSRLVMAFLPRRKSLLISWLQSPSAVILEPKKRKVCHCFHCFTICLTWSDGTGCHDLSFQSFKPAFILTSFTSSRGFWFFFTFCYKGGIICISEVIILLQAILIPACASSSLAFHMMYSAY